MARAAVTGCARRFILGALVILACLSAIGCVGEEVPDKGANQSLVEIGERSLERAEEFEDRGREAEANNEYRRALWAFRYHEQLTGEEPFLLNDALEGSRRTE